MAKYETYLVGDHEFDNVSYPVIVAKHDVNFDDLDASFQYTIPVPAGYLVLDVLGLVLTAFSGGTPVVNVGDGSNADAWLDSDGPDLDATTKGAVARSSQISANALAKGFYFESAGMIRLTMATGATAGKLRLLIFMVDCGTNWRTEDDL